MAQPIPIPTAKMARVDLELKVAELLADIVRLGNDKLAHLIASGAGPVQAHQERDLNWVTPKLFIAALGKEIALQYGLDGDSREHTGELNNYHHLM